MRNIHIWQPVGSSPILTQSHLLRPKSILLKPNELHIIRPSETTEGDRVGDHLRLADALRLPEHEELVAERTNGRAELLRT